MLVMTRKGALAKSNYEKKCVNKDRSTVNCLHFSDETNGKLMKE